MEAGVQSLLGKLTLDDIEKLKILLSIVPDVSQKEIITLRVFTEEYSNLINQNRSVAYSKSVIISLKHFTDFFGAQRSIQSIGLKDIESFISHLQRKVTKPVSKGASRGEGYRVYVRNLKAAFNKAIDWGYIKDNYFIKVKLPKKQQVNPAYISSDQLSVISSRIENNIVKEIVITAFYTGMRLNELMNLTWRNVDLTAKIITVGDEHFSTKGRNQRYIPICDEALTVISNRLPIVHKVHNDKSYVFCKPSGLPFTGDFISKRFKNACKAAGTDKGIHFHSLRHSFASNLAQKGVSLYTIKELLGHSSISTTEIYSHLNMDSLKDAIKTFDQPHPGMYPGQALNPLLVRRGLYNMESKMTYLWQEERGKHFYKIQTDEKIIADKLKRRNKFHLSAIALNANLWIYNCEFTRPDIAKKILKSVTCKNVKIDSEGIFLYE